VEDGYRGGRRGDDVVVRDDGGSRCHLSITASTCDFASEPDQQDVIFKVLPHCGSLGGCEGGGDYAVLVYVLRFDDPGVWTSANKRGRVPLYHACTLYSRIAEDGDGGGQLGNDIVVRDDGGSRCHSSITALTCDFISKPDQQHLILKVLPHCGSLGGCEAGDYAALPYALRFDEPGVWTSADERGCVPLYHACTLYSGITEDGDGGGRQGDDVVLQKVGIGLLHNEERVLSSK